MPRRNHNLKDGRLPIGRVGHVRNDRHSRLIFHGHQTPHGDQLHACRVRLRDLREQHPHSSASALVLHSGQAQLGAQFGRCRGLHFLVLEGKLVTPQHV